MTTKKNKATTRKGVSKQFGMKTTTLSNPPVKLGRVTNRMDVAQQADNRMKSNPLRPSWPKNTADTGKITKRNLR